MEKVICRVLSRDFGRYFCRDGGSMSVFNIFDKYKIKEHDTNWNLYLPCNYDNPKEEIINGLTLVFVELPKFTINTRQDKKLKIIF